MAGFDELLGEDSVKHSIDDLCADVEKFEGMEFVHIMWKQKGQPVHGSYYGRYDIVLGHLEVAKSVIIKRMEVEGSE